MRRLAWVIIGGGAACAGTHVLVPAGKTQTVQGIGLPGCDDRGDPAAAARRG